MTKLVGRVGFEPTTIVAFYEHGRVNHGGPFPALEDQLCTWSPGMGSPDRLDALVWALTDLSTRYEPRPARWLNWSIHRPVSDLYREMARVRG